MGYFTMCLKIMVSLVVLNLLSTPYSSIKFHQYYLTSHFTPLATHISVLQHPLPLLKTPLCQCSLPNNDFTLKLVSKSLFNFIYIKNGGEHFLHIPVRLVDLNTECWRGRGPTIKAFLFVRRRMTSSDPFAHPCL